MSSIIIIDFEAGLIRTIKIGSLLCWKDVRWDCGTRNFGSPLEVTVNLPGGSTDILKGVQDNAENRVMTPSVTSLIKHNYLEHVEEFLYTHRYHILYLVGRVSRNDLS